MKFYQKYSSRSLPTLKGGAKFSLRDVVQKDILLDMSRKGTVVQKRVKIMRHAVHKTIADIREEKKKKARAHGPYPLPLNELPFFAKSKTYLSNPSQHGPSKDQIPRDMLEYKGDHIQRRSLRPRSPSGRGVYLNAVEFAREEHAANRCKLGKLSTSLRPVSDLETSSGLPSRNILHGLSKGYIRATSKLPPIQLTSMSSGVSCSSILQRLHLSNQYFAAATAVAMAKGLGSNKSLSTLEIIDSEFEDARCARTLFSAISEGAVLHGLEEVAVVNCLGFSDSAIVDVITALGKRKNSLLRLSLCRNSKISCTTAIAISHVVQKRSGFCTLEQLDLSWCKNIKCKGAIALAAAVTSHSSSDKIRCRLERISLAACNIGESGATAFGAALKHKSSLRYLDLSMNRKVGKQSAAILAQGLHRNVRLQTLKLGHCRLGVDGVVSILTALPKNFGLDYVGLENCCAEVQQGEETLQALHEFSCICIARLQAFRSAKFGKGKLARVQLEFPHKLRYDRGTLRSAKWKNLLESLQDEVSQDTGEQRLQTLETARVVLWQPESSRLFKVRKRLSESGTMYESTAVADHAFEIDWKRCTSKESLMMYIDSIGDGNTWQAVDRDREMNEVKDVVRRRYPLVLDVFDYFATSADNEDPFSVSQEGFRQFVEMTSLFQLEGSGSTLMRLFRTINMDEIDSISNAEEDGNPNSAKTVVRYEFLEAILRVGIMRCLETKTDDLSGVLEVIFETKISRVIRLGPLHDRDAFRRERFYCEDVEKALLTHGGMALEKLYVKYCDRTKSKVPSMSFEAFKRMLDDFNLFDHILKSTSASRIFLWSKTRVSDDIKGRDAMVALDYCSWLEALGRIADYRETPTLESLREGGYYAGSTDTEGRVPSTEAVNAYVKYAEEYSQSSKKWLGGRSSAGPPHLRKTQPLSWKISCLAGWLLTSNM
eukprot:g3958.t1